MIQILHASLVIVAVGAVRAYQLLLAAFSGGACRFSPTCSAYAVEALTTHGLLRGGWLAIARVSRCHPLGPYGWDPVPPVETGIQRSDAGLSSPAIDRPPAEPVERAT